MARKRQIEPEFFVDEEIADFDFQSRLFYIGTWIYSEDTGVFEVKLKTLKGKIFPYDDNVDIQKSYEQIRDKGKFVEFISGGKTYAFIRGFHKRQSIQYPSRSFFPLPPEPYLSLIPSKIRKLNESSMSAHSTLSEASSRIELNRIELVGLSREEEESLKKIFNNSTSLKKHLENRGFKIETIEQVIKRIFPGKSS